MKNPRISSGLALLSLAIAGLVASPAFAAGSVQAMPAGGGQSVAADSNMPLREIDTQVRSIEQALPDLTRHEVMLQPGDLAGITEAGWSKLHTYSRDAKVERLKVYAPAGQPKTEEFYYRDGQLIMVFHEPNGAGHEGHNPNAVGKRYYFNAQGLFAIDENGRNRTTLDADDQAMGAKLQRVSAKLLALGTP